MRIIIIIIIIILIIFIDLPVILNQLLFKTKNLYISFLLRYHDK